MDFLNRLHEKISNSVAESLQGTGLLKRSVERSQDVHLKSIAEKVQNGGDEVSKKKHHGMR